MKLDIKAGATSNIFQIFIRDSSSTTGAGLTGLTSGSSGLTAYYHRDTDTTATVISLTSMTVGSFTSSGFAEISSANMPGWYQFCPPDASLAASATSCGFHLKGATNMAPLPIEIQLVAYNPQDAVRMGMTALPNAAAAASGGLMILGANATATSFTGGLTISSSSGDALAISSSGGNGNGMNVSGNGSGQGIKATGGATGRGIHALGGATSGSGFRAEGQGASAMGIHAIGGSAAPGMEVDGGATGAGLKIVGGATSGDGIDITTTAGDGISVLPTAGNALVLTANGTSKHGAVITGGTAGTSDGLKAVAGTGGVDIRGAITGNITGNLSGSTGSVTGAVGSVTGAVGSVTGNVGGNVVGSVASVSGAVGSVTGNVGGNVTGSVGSMASGGIAASSFAAGAIDAAAIAADAIGSSELATSAVNEIRDAILSDSTSFAGASIAAIKAKTDNLPATPAATGDAMALTTLHSPVLQSGTAQAGAAGTVTLASGASATDSLYKGLVVKIYGGTGAGQSRVITGYVGSTKVATVDWNWTTTPDNTSTYAVLHAEAPKLDSSQQVTAASVQGNVTGSVASVTGAVGSVTGNVGGNVVGSVASVSGAVGSVTGNVGGNVVGSVASVSGAVGSVTGAVGSVTGNVGGNVVGSTASVSGAVGSVTGNVGGNVVGSVASVAASVTVGTNSDKTGYTLSTAGIDAVLDRTVEGSYTFRQYLKLYAAALFGKLSGGATTTVVIRDTADSKDRVTAVVDSNGNRTSVTLDPS